jgi:hypothetical protein
LGKSRDITQNRKNGVHTFTQEYPRIPLEYPRIPFECPRIPQNINNIKILKDFGFFFFILLREIFHRRKR